MWSENGGWGEQSYGTSPHPAGLMLSPGRVCQRDLDAWTPCWCQKSCLFMWDIPPPMLELGLRTQFTCVPKLHGNDRLHTQTEMTAGDWLSTEPRTLTYAKCLTAGLRPPARGTIKRQTSLSSSQRHVAHCCITDLAPQPTLSSSPGDLRRPFPVLSARPISGTQTPINPGGQWNLGPGVLARQDQDSK